MTQKITLGILAIVTLMFIGSGLYVFMKQTTIPPASNAPESPGDVPESSIEEQTSNVINTTTEFQIPNFPETQFTIKSITMTHEDGRPDLPKVNLVLRTENNGTQKINGDFLQMFYLNKNEQLRFATHGVSPHGDSLEPLSEKDITYYFHVSEDAKQFILLYGPYSFSSGINEIAKSIDGFLIDFTTHSITSVPKEMFYRVTQIGTGVDTE